MKLLISTVNRLVLWSDGEVLAHRAGDFYGLTWDRRRLYVANRSRGGVVEICDAGLDPLATVPFPRLNDIHQVYWWGGVLYATHTVANRLETWDGSRRIGRVQWAEDGDSEHINSVWCEGGRFYVVEHRWGRQPPRVRIFDRDWDLTRTVELAGLGDAESSGGIHNAYVEDGTLYVCAHGCMVRCDLDGGEQERVDLRTGRPSYLRGLARTRDRFLVGESPVCERPDRKQGDARVLVLDGDLKLVDVILLPGAGQLHDVRVVDEPDRAHNGIRCPYWNWSRQLLTITTDLLYNPYN